MFAIIKKEVFSPEVKLIEVDAPAIAAKARPGQFVVLRIAEEGERIPLTIADFDREKGIITMVFQEVGKSTVYLGALKEGDKLANLIGPLGNPTEIEGYKKVLCVGGGIGIAPIFPIARGFKEAGAEVISIIGARTKELLIFEERMNKVSDRLIITTDDGSYERKALVTEPLKEILEEDSSIEKVVAIGPPIMMKFVAKTTQPFGIKTIVSLNSIMVDGTGMCGACRLEEGEETKFCCVDGPEFDGHKVNFDLLISRLNMYLDEEKASLEAYRKVEDK
ncbi:MAG: sulfide/dihydroorotate dehydrogenase-like FAD/NAD-binding protein [Deltaproteobacteria bacterium]|nr:MAG: sulfide/dihydroorotate dehydrogenase-like FAD/NAD-binding protein [Deltaproteobacteria bacterium]